jgi:hypothetical protein
VGCSDGAVRIIGCRPNHSGFDEVNVRCLPVKNLFPGRLITVAVSELRWNDSGVLLIASVDIGRDVETAGGDIETIEGGVVIWCLCDGSIDVKYVGLLESHAGVQGVSFLPSASDRPPSIKPGSRAHFDQTSCSIMFNLDLFVGVDPTLQSLRVWDVGNTYCVAELCEDDPILGSVLSFPINTCSEDSASIILGGAAADIAIERARVVYAHGWGEGETQVVLAALHLCLHRRDAQPSPIYYYRLTKLHQISVKYNLTCLGRGADYGVGCSAGRKSSATDNRIVVPSYTLYFAANASKNGGALLFTLNVWRLYAQMYLHFTY